jgi:outer membrane protein assembly factor BamB
MALPLLDLATQTPVHSRSLTHGESDRAHAGSALAILVHDATGHSAGWPQALAAYRHLWAGYKGHAPLRRVSELLSTGMRGLAADRDFLSQPEITAAFLGLDGGHVLAYATRTALVLVRHGSDLAELGPDGFHPLPESGTLARSTAGTGLVRGSLALSTGDAICLMSRQAAARVGLWRLREAMSAQSAADLLTGLGPLDEPVLAARLNRAPAQRAVPIEGVLAAVANASPRAESRARIEPRVEVESTDLAAPNAALPERSATAEPEPSSMPGSGRDEESAPEASFARAQPQAEPDADPSSSRERDGAPPLFVRSGRRHREAEPSWRERWLGGSPPRPESERERHARTDLPEQPIPEASTDQRFELEPAPSGEPQEDLFFSPDMTASREPELVLGEGAGAEGMAEGSIMVPSRRSLRAEEDEAGWRLPGNKDSFLLRRWFTWATVGLGLVAALVIIILIGRFLTGAGPTGPKVEGLDVSSRSAGSGAGGEEDPGVPPLPPFSGASWTKTFKDAITSSPLVVGERVIFGGRDGNLYALSIQDGVEAWRLRAGSGMGSSPAAAGDLVVIGTYGGDVLAADAVSGTERWRSKTGGKIVSSPAFDAASGLVVIGSHDSRVYALNAVDGTTRWKAATGGIVWASPTIDRNRVFVGSHDKMLYCLDLESGNVVWRSSADDAVSTTAAVAGERVVIGTTKGTVAAYALADGKRLWTRKVNSACGGAAVVAGDMVLIGTDVGNVLALNLADGAERYRVRTGDAVKCRPAVSGDLAWITGYDGNLRVFDLTTGEEQWKFKAKGRLYSSPAVLGRTAFFGSMDNLFYAATWPEKAPATAR